MMNGFIVLHRKLLDWEWHDDFYMGWLWVTLLLMANHEDKKWRGKVIKRGQLVTDLASLSAQTGLSVRQIRTRLDRLVECECIDKQTTNKFTIITICNYSNYQDMPEDCRQTNDKQMTNNRQTNDKGSNNNNNNISLECDNNTREEQKSGELTLWSNDELFEELAEAEGQQSWREAVCMNLHFAKEGLVQALREFNELVKMRKEAHDSIQDYARHFTNYMYQNINSRKNEDKKSNTAYISRDEQRKAEADARRREAEALVAKLVRNCT